MPDAANPGDLVTMTAPDFFNADMAKAYDARNSGLAAISENMHFLVRLVLADLPPRARILSVGAGTGAEILALAKANAAWTFVAVDPSASMLDVCRERLAEAGVLERCELIHGYVQDAPTGENFDAVLSILVAHFVPRAAREDFYRQIHARLKPGGRFVSTEIAGDLEAPAFPEMLKNWAQVQTLMGATPESLRALPEMLRNSLTVLTAEETEASWKVAGFATPIPFFQSFMIRGWHAVKG